VVLFGYGSRGRIFVSHSGPMGWINLGSWLPKLPAAEGALSLPTRPGERRKHFDSVAS
jgi:hypothetical protein